MAANFWVPNGVLLLRQGTEAKGAFFGRDVDVGLNVQVDLESGLYWPPLADLTIAGVDPDTAEQDTTVDLVISGAGFIDRAQVGGDGTGVTVNTVTVSSGSTLTANVSVAADAELGPRDLTVTNPTGHSATLSGTITVVERPPAPESARVFVCSAAGLHEFDLQTGSTNHPVVAPRYTGGAYHVRLGSD